MILNIEFEESKQNFSADFGEIIDNTRKPVIEPLTITENGEYIAAENVDGFSPVIVDIIGGETEEYKGSYEVIPKIEEQTLKTAFKVMRNDVKIKEIPYAEVINDAGGNTVTIG